MIIQTKEVLMLNAREKETLQNAYRIACELIEKATDEAIYNAARHIADGIEELKHIDEF